MFELIEIFCSWCRQKIALHESGYRPAYRQGELWWCSWGMNVGDELYGKGDRYQRPVLILKKFSRNLFLGLPMTLQEKSGTYFVETKLNGVRRWVILSQARTVDASRLIDPIGEFDVAVLKQIREEFFKLIAS